MNVYIHVGLPKTGTTTLQDVFADAEKRNIYYIGKRNKHDNSNLFYEINKYINSTVKDKVVAERIKKEVDAIGFEAVLLSDEMILVDTRVTWQEKLVRLNELFGEYNLNILLFVRDPLDAIYSFLVEMKNIYRKITVEEFARSNQFKIFDYHYLNGLLKVAFTNKMISVYSFEKFFSNSSGKVTDFLLEKYYPTFSLEGNHSNSKKKSALGYYSNEFSLYDFVYKVAFIRNAFSWVGAKYKRKVILFAKRFKLNKGSVVPVLSCSDKYLIYQMLSESQKAFDEEYGFEYAENMKNAITKK